MISSISFKGQILKPNPSLLVNDRGNNVSAVDRNCNKISLNNPPAFGAAFGANFKPRFDMAKILEKLRGCEIPDKFEPIVHDMPTITIKQGVRSGTLKSHPHFKSSNGSELPQTKEEIIALYQKHVPERYQKFLQLGIFDNNELATVDGKLAGRYAPADENTEKNMRIALKRGWVDPKKHVVIADMGGAHSIAAARELANSGYVIIPHFNHENIHFGEENTAALAYFAKEISEINAKTIEKNPNAPWAMIVDAHQNDEKGLDKFCRILENPDIPEVPDGFNVIRLTEGKNPIAVPLDEHYVDIFKSRGVQVFDLGLDSYKKSDLYDDQFLFKKFDYIFNTP